MQDGSGVPSLSWRFDQDVLDAEAAVDGWYALLTPLTAEQADPADVLIRYKGQGAVEPRYHDFKGPLVVTPVFVQHNHRVAALIQVICLDLLVFSLIERQPWWPRPAIPRDPDCPARRAPCPRWRTGPTGLRAIGRAPTMDEDARPTAP
ncbi:hypothetical protein [Streptomyces sp. NPDC000880]